MTKIVELAHFTVPFHVTSLKEDANKRYNSWELKDLSVETLSELCDKFRADVFERAGKVDPRSETKWNPLTHEN
jgi:hypothetical protein